MPPARAADAALHVRLEESTPAEGATVGPDFGGFRLRFSAAVEAGLTTLRLVGPGGDTVRLAVRTVSDSAAVLRADAPPLREGGHLLLWRTVSVDGHAVTGSIPFIVAPADVASADVATGGAEPRAQTPAEPTVRDDGETRGPAPLRRTLLRGFGLACLLAAAGLLWFAGGTSLVREPRVLRAAVATSLGAAILLTLAQLDWLAGALPEGVGRWDGVLAALGTRTGAVGLTRSGLALLVFFLVGGAHAGRLAAVLAMAAAVVGSTAGHPASIEPGIAIAANALHLGAAAIWTGGVLLLAVLPDRSQLSDTDWVYADVAGRVSARAFLAVGMLVGTALLQDYLFLESIPQLWETPYGRLLMAKGAGLGLLLGFGAWHRWRTLPRLVADGDPRPLRRAVRLEIWVLVAVILVAAWLAQVPPPVAD